MTRPSDSHRDALSVGYPLSVVPKAILPLYLLNPMAVVIAGYRSAILNGTSPDAYNLTVATIMTGLLLAAGYAIFKRAEQTFADVI